MMGFFNGRSIASVDLDSEFRNLFLDEYLGGGFKYVLFSPLFGEDSHFD